MMTKEKKLLYKGRVFELIQESVRLPNGLETAIDTILHPGAAAIVAITETKEVVLISQSGRGDKDIFTVADAFSDEEWSRFIQQKAKEYDAEHIS